MLYGLQHTDTDTGNVTLCEVEGHVVYECGTRLQMLLAAHKYNRFAAENDWASRYRAVPLPAVGVPEWAAR